MSVALVVVDNTVGECTPLEGVQRLMPGDRRRLARLSWELAECLQQCAPAQVVKAQRAIECSSGLLLPGVGLEEPGGVDREEGGARIREGDARVAAQRLVPSRRREDRGDLTIADLTAQFTKVGTDHLIPFGGIVGLRRGQLTTLVDNDLQCTAGIK